MNSQSSGHSSQPPVHNSQHALSIRTNTPTSTPRGPPSSSPSQPHSTYPIPIPKEKLSKAIELFARYRYAKGLDQRSQDNEPTHVDTLLNPGAAQSVTSRSSRVYTPSVSTSAYDGLTDISSLVSFTGEESILSGKGNGSTELIAYNGKRVKQRVRKRLSPMAKAKAALIRHLGSCPTCHSRRVPCPMEHHDVKALEKGLNSRSRKQREQASQEQSRSSVSTSSNHAAESGPVPVNSSGVSLVQSNTLFGLGQNPQLLETISTSASDPQSLAADPLAGIQAQGHTPLLPNSVEFSRLFGANPYESYQDGQILALGVLRQYYICQHLDGLCDQSFESPEALEEHFESAHFTFARLDPPYRYICSNCQYWNTSLNSRCQQCRANGAVEVWIYGNFIRTPFYPRYPPDGHDPFKIEISSLHELSSPYDTPATDSQFGGGPAGIAGFTGGVNQGGYTYNYQNHNIYPAPNSPSHGFGAYGPSPSGESHNHHSGIAEDQSEAEGKLLSISFWYSKARNYQRRYKPVLIVILLLISMAAVLDLCDWLILKIEGFQPRLYLPAIGFVAVLASFVVGYALCSAYALYSANHRESHGVQCRPRRCPLHDFHTLSLDCRTIGSPIHVSINGG